MSVSKQYTREIREGINYVATWLPNLQLSLGDVGIVKNYEFKHISTLEDFGIAFEEVSGTFEVDLDYSSSDAVEYTLKAAGSMPVGESALAKVDAGVLVSFSRANAVWFQMSGCKSSRIKDKHGLGNKILELNKNKKWPNDYVVVTEVVEADASTILISKGREALVELLAEGAMEPAGLQLANLDSRFRLVRESQMGMKIVSSEGLTPLLRLSGIKKRILRRGIFRSRAPEFGNDSPQFESVDYDDFSEDADG